jgi:hypothetical protein
MRDTYVGLKEEQRSRPINTVVTDIRMQLRKCCGTCGRTFKVHPNSKQTRASKTCGCIPEQNEKPIVLEESVSTMKIPIYEKKEKKENHIPRTEQRDPIIVVDKSGNIKKEDVVKEKRPLKIVGVDRQLDPKKKWEELVNRAKAKIKTMHKARMEIAEIAVEACDILWGGGAHWNKFKGVHTLKDFAKEAGIHYKTLAQWVRIKRNIKDKLPPSVWQDDKYMIAMRADRKVKRDMNSKEVQRIYEQELLRDNDSHILLQGLKRVSSLRYFIYQHAKFIQLPKDELIELRDYCQDIVEKINAELGDWEDLELFVDKKKDGASVATSGRQGKVEIGGHV